MEYDRSGNIALRLFHRCKDTPKALQIYDQAELTNVSVAIDLSRKLVYEASNT
jgi:hypothetical protein